MVKLSEKHDIISGGVKAMKLSLRNGWSGLAATSFAGGHFGPSDWRQSLKEPDQLIDSPEQVLKSDGDIAVIVKTLDVGNMAVRVVIKRQKCGDGFAGFCKGLLPGRSLRNFAAAERLRDGDIPVALPLAAIERKCGFITLESIYITEYIAGSKSLHEFLRDDLSAGNEAAAVKKTLAEQIGRIFAAMHNTGLWHRDGKAGNFLVRKDDAGGYEIVLVDMDGIKQYGLRGPQCRWRGLCKLASTVLWHGSIYMTDYFRVFKVYSELTGLKRQGRKEVFKGLIGQAVGLRLLSVARALVTVFFVLY